ncbi:phosphoribosylanthranilate isomerase [Chitinophaga sp. GCM10012297]|uniref:N-(5'-phosphoribosyl)anthranilate isomerase n=1 Tax=Chitinophaga chungangae TaxID=2821488 RepID=A0ABS3Y8L2_9BACT|nr:phosphoribosylanthranilate isomerase [Chitinophaga chungangae]MBO9151019.1 phosphoribosylanthranilate isomerase [Chitinophaga chungangae]
MKIKVCGITRKEDLDALVQLGADYAGFIFYGKSPRFVGNKLDGRTVRETGGKIGKVGVFVNADPQQVLQTVKDYGLDMVQLHGEESIAVCQQLRLSVPVIKAFPMGEKAGGADYAAPFMAVTDYFLFDTAGKEYGGTGRQFDWQLLNGYSYDKPFFLSGGIGPEDAEAVLRWRHGHLFSLDVNSRFETAPGVKDMDKVAAFIKTIKK